MGAGGRGLAGGRDERGRVARGLRGAEHRRRAGLDPLDRHRTARCRRRLRRGLRTHDHGGRAPQDGEILSS